MIKTVFLLLKTARRSVEPNNLAGLSAFLLTKINPPLMSLSVQLKMDVFQVKKPLNLLLPNLVHRTASNNTALHNLKTVEKILDALEHFKTVISNANLI